MSAADAVAAGATYLVIGRPITGAADPRAAAEQIAGASCARGVQRTRTRLACTDERRGRPDGRPGASRCAGVRLLRR